MALDDLLHGIESPGWIAGALLLAGNAVGLAYVTAGPTGILAVDGACWLVALLAVAFGVSRIAFRRARWRTTLEWTGIVLLAGDFLAIGVHRLASGVVDARAIAATVVGVVFGAGIALVALRRVR